MRWPWQKGTAATVTVRQTQAFVRCPTCSGTVGVPAVNLKSYSISFDGKVLEETVGYRVCCQGCPTIYSVVGTGVYRHHVQSSPLTPEVRRPPVDDEVNGPAELPPQRQRPIPKERPRA